MPGRSIVPRHLSQLITDQLVAANTATWDGRLRWQAFSRLRKGLARLGTPPVSIDFEGSRLSVPLDHDLPLIRKRHPDYSRNVGRLAKLISKQRPDLRVVDIGANVGDTVFILKAVVDCRVLCIEGDPLYFEYLETNTARFPDVERACVLVGPPQPAPSLSRIAGSATLRGPAGGGSLTPLEDVLAAHTAFETASLLKIDTDGYDLMILDNAAPWIQRAQPVLFFEYAPDLWPAGFDGSAVLRRLVAAGYSKAVLFRASGEYDATLDTLDDAACDGLRARALVDVPSRYLDIALFPHADVALGEAFARSEAALKANPGERFSG